MTKTITENTGVVIRYGVIGVLLLAALGTLHNRLSAVEIVQAEQKTDIKYIKEGVDRIESRLAKP
jgi:hypothetical protein